LPDIYDSNSDSDEGGVLISFVAAVLYCLWEP
jgi:hypothetical protein